MKTAVLIPAYGRDYKNAGEVRKAFEEGKDFLICNTDGPWSGKPCNLRDLEKFGDYNCAEIRYHNNAKCIIVKLNINIG